MAGLPSDPVTAAVGGPARAATRPMVIGGAAFLLGPALIVVAALLMVFIRGDVSGAGLCGAADEVTPASFQGGGDEDPGPGVPPRNFIPAYFAAANQPDAQLGQRLGPYVLMAIHEIESNFGRSNAPGVKRGINKVGSISCCKGPFQFYDKANWSTWKAKSRFGARMFGRDGDGDGDVDIYSNFDGMFAAAAYLYHSGAPDDWSKAILSYNRSTAYRDKVLARARYFQANVPPPRSDGGSLTKPPDRKPPVVTLVKNPKGVVVGASRFGGPGDPGTGRRGYRGDDLSGKAAFAELGYSTTTNESNANTGLLGNLPYRTVLRISYGGRSVEAAKLDIGRGGGPVEGKARAIDLWWEVAEELGFKGTGLVTVERVDGGAVPELAAAGVQTAGYVQGCAAPADVEQVVEPGDGGPYQVPLPKGTYTVTSVFWKQRPNERHPGVDLGAPTGTPIYAAGAGKVVLAGVVSGYGNYTCIEHTQTLVSCYGHQSAILVKEGERVRRGQLIGKVGSTGNSTGPHLHFETRFRLWGPTRCPANYVGVPPKTWCAADAPGFGDDIKDNPIVFA